MSVEILAKIFGFAGDAATFAGALMLALKEAGEEKRVRQAVGTAKAYAEHPELKEILVVVDSVPIKAGEDVEIILAKRASNISRHGAWVLAAGFICLLGSRILEAVSPYK